MVKEFSESGDPSRWVVLILFCFFSASNAIQWITYAPISTTVKEFFGVTTNELNMLSSVYMIVFVVGVYFSSTTFEKWGVRQGLLVGCFLNALGAVLKVVYGMQRPGFTPLIISQTINSVAQLFVLSTPPLIAAQYFPPSKRAIATTIACTANNLGNAVALFLPPFLVKTGTSSEFYTLFGFEMGVCVLILVLVFFFLKPPRFLALERVILDNERAYSARRGSAGAGTAAESKANAPVGLSSEEEAVEERGPSEKKGFWHGATVKEFLEVGHTVGRLCRRSDFLFLFGAFSISMGSVWTYASVLAQVLEPFGVSAELAGIAAAMNIVVGIIVSYFVCLWVDHKRRYKFPIIVCLSGSLACYLGFMILLLKAPSPSTLMNVLSTTIFIIAGIFQNTTTPICFEFAMEIAFPLQESVPGSMLMVGSNMVSLILVIISSYILGDGTATKRSAVSVVIIIVSICAVGTLLVLPPRERLNRRDAELLAKEQLTLPDQEGHSGGTAPDTAHSRNDCARPLVE